MNIDWNMVQAGLEVIHGNAAKEFKQCLPGVWDGTREDSKSAKAQLLCEDAQADMAAAHQLMIALRRDYL